MMKKKLLVASVIVFTVILIASLFLFSRKEAPVPAQKPPERVKEEVPEKSVEEAAKEAPEQTAVYLEIIETNTDTFSETMVQVDAPFSPSPFWFTEGALIIDEKILGLTDEEINASRIFLRKKIRISEGKEASFYLVHFIKFKGVSRKTEKEEFYAGDSFPFLILRPAHEKKGPRLMMKTKNGKEKVIEPVREQKDFILNPSESAYETFVLRFWQSDIELKNITADGEVEISYAGRVFSLKPEDEKNLPGGEKTLKIIKQHIDGSEEKLGNINFTTGLLIKNYGKVKVMRSAESK